MSSDAFIGLIREEYRIKSNRARNGTKTSTVGSSNLAVNQGGTGTGKSLEARITDRKESPRPYCDYCKRPGHWTSRCRKNPSNKCFNCGKQGHRARDCRAKKKGKNKERGKEKGKENNEESNMMQDVVFVANETDEGEIEERYNFSTYETCNADEIDERLIYYDWLADSATTSHICCQRDAFTSYTPANNVSVTGVGSKKADIAGRGTVELISTCEGTSYNIRLENVLHIPDQRNNLISLGRWDSAGGRYCGGKGQITLVTKDGKRIATGTKVENHLYKMNISTKHKLSTMKPSDNLTFVGQNTPLNWETWHRRFGHVGYSGLQKLFDNKLVEGFNVDLGTSKPDCIACTEAKQHVEPFPKEAMRQTEPGELTHIDLWGKYAIRSINGNQYYLLFVDDAKRYITVECLKEKSDAAQLVINYLAHLITQGKKPKAIQIDGGKEFVNENLKSWCKERGIEIHITAPYSPSQNGVAERMNRTIVELARAMLRAQDLPEFLWEYSTTHAVYIRNRSYTTHLPTETPYEGWHGHKPNISHLREFGAPVWILLQGQKQDRKMLPKSKRQVYVGFDEGAKAVKYYNAATHQILTSRNFCHLNPPPETPPEEIIIQPLPRHEGESGSSPQDDMPRQEGQERRTKPERKRKHCDNEDDINIDEPRKTRGIRIDYKAISRSYEAIPEEEDEETFLLEDEAYAIIAGDELNSLRETKQSPDWPTWSQTMDVELNQLEKMGTWELVPKPPGVIPIPNKWTFVKKRNKEGEVVRHRARLVVKGCAQRFGQDYMETYSPVIRLDTLRAILALVPIKKLIIQQMDVKGAYLNGILEEVVYMKQPEGREDGTERICRLIKTMYGLKQAGREWNKLFDSMMKKHGFQSLLSDPCAYVKWDGSHCAIIAVWVDDLLLFATTERMMDDMKQAIRSEWEVTDLGEPRKIVGIEVTQTPDSLTISQTKYIESILRNEGLEEANPVATPMDPTIKLVPNPQVNEPNRSNSYAKRLGELQYIANGTRPDISCPVNKLAAFTANPSMQHYTALKRILRYLAGTKTLGITYRKPKDDHDEENLFHGFADAAYANNFDLKSTTGYVFMATGGAITWKSKKQSIIALSSTEAEYVALSEAGREACWLRNLYKELGFPQSTSTIMKGDNEGSITLTQNPQFHQRSKHIEIRHHWVRELVKNKVIDIHDCRDPEQTADILTKPLLKPKHQRHTEEMGVLEPGSFPRV
jgi:hypothetical protein